jgi:hypothetical protein
MLENALPRLDGPLHRFSGSGLKDAALPRSGLFAYKRHNESDV